MSERVTNFTLSAYADSPEVGAPSRMAHELIERRTLDDYHRNRDVLLASWQELGESPKAVRAELERLRTPRCNTCGGGLSAHTDCICGGKGTQAAEIDGMRDELLRQRGREPAPRPTPLEKSADDSFPGAALPDGWRVCEFCGCTTNARARACCDRGRDADVRSTRPTALEALEREYAKLMRDGIYGPQTVRETADLIQRARRAAGEVL